MTNETSDRGALHFIHSNNKIQEVEETFARKTQQSEITRKPGKNALQDGNCITSFREGPRATSGD